MKNLGVSLSVYYHELKQEFDRIQRWLDNRRTTRKQANRKQPQPYIGKRLSAGQIQAIKDEVHAEETHSWTNHGLTTTTINKTRRAS